MFSRRKRANSQPSRGPHTGPPKSTAASTAAAQAFLANRASNGNLSSAAAAAALRSLTLSPTPVGEVQTKRMQRRGSQGSVGSAPGGLRRQGSSGSMSERTFRDQSPGRGAGADLNAPPMPALPKEYVSPPPTNRAPRRPMSTEPPARVVSPPPKLPAGRGVSLDRGPGVLPSPRKKITKAQGSSQADGLAQDPRRSSINFSRPMSPQNSPPVSPTSVPTKANGDARKSQAANTAANVAVLSNAERTNIEHAVNEAAAAPVKKKKKAALQQTEGSHFAAGTSGARPTGTAIGNDTDEVEETVQAPAPRPRKKKAVVEENTGSTQNSADDTDVSESGSGTDHQQNYTNRTRGGLSKQPSLVREEREAEEQEERGIPFTPVSTKIQNGVPTSTESSRSSAKETPKSNTGSKIVPKADALSVKDEQQAKRTSLSPARHTHFSAQPIFETPSTRKHQPPARSVSPAKSAMKQSPSPRGTSPNGPVQSWNKPGHTASEMSDQSSLMSEEGLAKPRRRSVRVSFDDEPTIVGQAAQPETPTSPVLSSPQDGKQVKRSWFNFGKDKSKNQPGTVTEESDELQPVPVLPSFGSIRGSKRPQDKPATSHDHKVQHALKTLTQSNDHAVGAVLAQDKESKSQEQPHAISYEPLPPEVTTVEGSGYHSDTESSVAEPESETEQIRDEVAEPHKESVPQALRQVVLSPEVPTTSAAILDVPKENTVQPPQEAVTATAGIPEIAVQPATPGFESADQKPRDSWLGMPGDFPKEAGSSEGEESATELSGPTDAPSTKTIEETSRPSEVGIAEPEPEEAALQHDPEVPAVGHIAQTIRQQTPIPEEDEESDSGNSIYSDAAEDQSDLEGDGFGSINAIVESPMPKEKKKKVRDAPEPPPSPPPKSKARERVSLNLDEPAEPIDANGWEKAQNYWSGLSTSRKAEIEQAARVSEPEPEPKKKATKPVTQRSEREPKRSVKAKAPTMDEDEDSDEAPAPVAKPKKSIKPAANHPAPAPTTEPITKTAARTPSLRKSMRETPAQQTAPEAKPSTQLRSSMRDGSPRTGSLRAPAPKNPRPQPMQRISSAASYSSNEANGMPVPKTRGALQKKQRPMSAAGPVSQSASAAGGAMRARPASVGGSILPAPAKENAPPMPKPAHRRQMSEGSDSDSSFKRARRNKSQSSDGRYSMRRSMRANSVAERPQSSYTPAAAQPSSRAFSVRSLSPAGNSRKPGGMRTSLRAASPEPERPQSPTRSLFGRKSKAKAAPPPQPSKPAPRYKSRFADSDDSDERPTTFRSRFADSSDEDEPAPLKLTPVRGIPRRADDGDSTDLDDSDDEKKSRKPAKNAAPLPPTPLTIPDRAAAEGSALASGTLRRSGSGREALNPVRDEEKKKRSFFGNLGRRKEKSTKVGKVDFESAARRDTKLERTKAERDGLRSQVDTTPTDSSAPVDSPTASPKSPKLQRRNPSRTTSDSWPLPPPIPDSPAPPSRPVTSDGTKPASRPTLGDRGFSAVSATTGKKKRFPMLRKAFGLHD